MAAKGDSKQGLVITLVFFVLLSILLGVVAYFGFAEQEGLINDKKKEIAKAAAMAKERDYYRSQSLIGRVYSGHLDAKDLAEMSSNMEKYFPYQDVGGKKQRKLKIDFEKSDRDDIEKYVQALDSELGWQENQKKPASTYKTELGKRDKEIDDLKGNVKNEQEKVVGLNRELADKNKALNDARAAFKEDLAKLRTEPLVYVLTYLKNLTKEELEKEIARVKEAGGRVVDNQAKMIEDLQKELEQIGTQRTALQNQIGDQDERYKKLVSAKDKEIEELTLRLNKALDKMPRPSFVDMDVPKGKIVEIDRSGQLPFINIGRADNVKSGLTFSIHGTDLTGKANKEPKGSLEVLEVLGDRLAQARVTALKDPNRDPIMKGDLLFNLSWSPTLKQHVAIAGIVDLSGDAQKDNVNQVMRSLLEFKRNLEEQGVVVDGYLDLKENALKGAISRQTDYLILGETPDFGSFGALKDDDPKMQRRTNILAQMTKLQQEAVQNGVTIISLRKFLVLTGYRVPRSIHPDAPTVQFRGTNSTVPSPLDRQAPIREPGDKPPVKDNK